MKVYDLMMLFLCIQISIALCGSALSFTAFSGMSSAGVYAIGLAVGGTVLGLMTAGALVQRYTFSNASKFIVFNTLFTAVFLANFPVFGTIETFFFGSTTYTLMVQGLMLILYVVGMIQLESGGWEGAK